MLSGFPGCNFGGGVARSTAEARHELPSLEEPMRTTILSVLAAATLAAPLTAQQPRSPAPVRRPAVSAVRGDSGAVPRLTEAQHDKLDAIRARYAKERRAERAASRARHEKMRAEINAVLTPEQRARMEERGKGMRGQRTGARGTMPMRGQRGGARGAMPMMGGHARMPTR